MVLAAAGVHTHLVRKGLRSYASINVRSAECLDTHYFAVLIGVGATTVNAYLAEAAIADRHARGLFGDLTLEQCLKRHRKAIDDGLLKIMSKMGIAVISSYRGGYNFEAVGLSRALCNDLFPGMPAKISGEGYASLQLNATQRHEAAFDEVVTTLPIGGFYRQRAGGEAHAYSAQLMHLLQTAVRDRQLFDLPAILARGEGSAAGLSARPARVQLGARGDPDRQRRGDHRDPQALRHPRHVARRAHRPRRTRRWRSR